MMRDRLFRAVVVVSIFMHISGYSHLCVLGQEKKSFFHELQKYRESKFLKWILSFNPFQKNDQITHKRIKENSSVRTVDVIYPQFTDGFSCINNDIKNVVMHENALHAQRNEEEFREFSMGDPLLCSMDSFPRYFNVTYEITFKNDRFVSFLLEFDCYDRGAHGYRFWKAFNYDLHAKKYLTFQVFVPNAKMMSKLGILCGAAIAKDYPWIKLWDDIDWTQYEKDYQLFNFSPDSLIIQFDEYEVCSRCHGVPWVVIKANELLSGEKELF